jgi:signal transduction histidine kinase
MPATGSGLDAVGRLAQYVLVPRIAAPGLTLVALQRDPQLLGVLLLVVPVMMGLNYLALRHWEAVIADLRIADKQFYLLLDSLLGLTVLAIVGVGTPMVLYLVAAGMLAGLVYRAVSAITASVVATTGYVAILLTHGGAVPGGWDFHTTVTLPSLILTAGAAGVALRRLLNQQDRTARQLARLRENAAIRDERLRMARDMHDSLTKNLHGVWLLSRTLVGALDRGDVVPARNAARVIGQTAQNLTEEARHVITGLRDDPESQSLAEAFRMAAARSLAGHSVAVEVRDLRWDPAASPESGVRHELLAIVAESMHNALKHAAPGRIQIQIEDDGPCLVVSIIDDGRGFVAEDAESLPAMGHFGLLGMGERAARVGGRLTVSSAPGSGTTVKVTIAASGPARAQDGAPGGPADRQQSTTSVEGTAERPIEGAKVVTRHA